MTGFLGSPSTLDCVYFLLFGIGVLWALFVVFTGGLGGDADVDLGGDVDVPDLDVGGGIDSFDAGSVDVSPISPITISSFITAFGAVGVITRQMFGASGPVSLVAAAVGGFVVAGAMFLFYSKFLIGSQGSSEVRIHQLVGLIGEVITPISENGVGEIAVVAQGARVTYPARSSTGAAIERGALAQIDRMMGTQALVSRHEPES